MVILNVPGVVIKEGGSEAAGAILHTAKTCSEHDNIYM